MHLFWSAFVKMNKTVVLAIICLTISIIINSCKESEITIVHKYRTLDYDKIGDYLFDFKGTDQLTFTRFVNGVPKDTLHFVKEAAIFDSLEFEVEYNPGETNEIIHVEREFYKFIEQNSSQSFEIQIWADNGGFIDANIYFHTSDLYFLQHVGDASFGIGDGQSNGYQPEFTSNGNLYKEVWNDFDVYGILRVTENSFDGSYESEFSDLWYCQSDGPVEIKINDQEYWYRID
ncbi:MAG: hypothetical protein ACI8ZN_000222 [Bacteroidia bacterium]|jgi:hypothetical protein